MSRSKILFLPGIFLTDCPETDEEESGEVLEICCAGHVGCDLMIYHMQFRLDGLND